jgi:site-specific DNA-cytosine methylase
MPTVLGVCAGNGAVLLPFKKWLVANIEPRSVFKHPKDVQWKANFEVPLFGDKDRMFGAGLVKPDVIIGHPDCGHSSMLALSRGKKFKDPKENHSLSTYLKAIQFFKPKVFLFENLPALLKTYPDIDEAFCGYNLRFIQGSVTQFGNSQKTRKRLVIIGVREDQDLKVTRAFKLPKQKNPHLKKFGELVSSLEYPNEALGHIRLPLNERIAMFGGCQMSLREIKMGWQTRPGLKRWPTGENKMKNAPGVYRNLKNDYPLTVRKGNREFDQHGNIMSPRQRARIQGIPDEFKIVAYPNNIKYGINKGNVTVTKCFPYEISIWFKRCLKRAGIL